MAVYTQVPQEALTAFLSSYDIGTLVSYEGISQGVSNTNYFVDTDMGRYVLTLFEPHRVRDEDISFFMDYAIVLEKAGVPCPETLTRKDGSVCAKLCGRPAAIFSFLNGSGGHVSMLTPALCEKAGATLAKMHRAAERFGRTAPNHFGPTRWQEWLNSIGAKMDVIAPGLYDLTSAEFESAGKAMAFDLPRGAIHADYFPDNVFFEDGDVSGVIDFHFVCTDLYAYDLAIAINAWSFDEKNEMRRDRMDAMMRGYESVRPLTDPEKGAFPALLRAAALRFLLSRVEEKLNWKEGDFMTPHDPMVFEKRLRYFQTFAEAA
ncbi:MAG: homoserine kinase [Micavibrio aeruginosavorus]|uniref:Homoserine kinase n=1 Tax=Micavibrio aeruginosavorus TaxID=349221 RepID=A0A2W5C1R2_9BACT|nr:MAG: homoserine kinase [Micavibrio aeruginosavorus]